MEKNLLKIMNQDGDFLRPYIASEFSNIIPSISSFSLSLNMAKIITDILENNLKSIKSEKRVEIIKGISIDINKYILKLAETFNIDRTLISEADLPKIIDELRIKGYITKDLWKKLLDLLLILDGLEIQEEILDEDIRDLYEISHDLKRLTPTYLDESSNLLYLQLDVFPYQGTQ